ncbi:hypothetical protein N7449_001260, partial [Penicillium cf. viridicatum]
FQTSRTDPSPRPKRICYSPILSDHHLIELTPPNIRLKREWWSHQRTKTLGIGFDLSRWRHDHRPHG